MLEHDFAESKPLKQGRNWHGPRVEETLEKSSSRHSSPVTDRRNIQVFRPFVLSKSKAQEFKNLSK